MSQEITVDHGTTSHSMAEAETCGECKAMFKLFEDTKKLVREASAGKKLAQTIQMKVGDPGSYPVWIDEALAAYDEEVGPKE